MYFLVASDTENGGEALVFKTKNDLITYLNDYKEDYIQGEFIDFIYEGTKVGQVQVKQEFVIEI